MNKQIMERINQETAKLKKRLNKDCYDIPEEKCITIGDNTIISGIYLEDSDYKGIPFVNGYLEVANANFMLACDVLEDKIGWQIVNILVHANVTKRYTFRDIRDILDQMHDYVCEADSEGCKEYFKEITNTSLFHDAVGKLVGWDKDNTFVDVTEEY